MGEYSILREWIGREENREIYQIAPLLNYTANNGLIFCNYYIILENRLYECSTIEHIAISMSRCFSNGFNPVSECLSINMRKLRLVVYQIGDERYIFSSCVSTAL